MATQSFRFLRRAALVAGLAAVLLGTGAAPKPPAAQGIIKALVPEFTLRLAGDRGLIDVHGKDGVARVAPGQYWVLGWTAALRDAQGRRWTASARTFGDAASAQLITVAKERPTGVQLAPPIKAHLSADAVGNRVNFRLHFFGPGGETCSEVKVDGALPPKPWLTIRDTGGKEVARFEFDYGCSFFCTNLWRAPKELKGSYTASVAFDFGPIQVETPAPVAFTLEGVDPDLVAARPGAEAPDFTLKAAEDGQPLQLRAMRPRPLLLCFFCACPACAIVAQELSAPREPKPELIAIFNDPEFGTPAGAKAFREKTGWRGAILADPGARVGAQYDSVACPRCWVIDAHGMIRYVNPEPTQPPKEIAETALKHLTR